MIDVRTFIKNLGKEAPAYFGVTEKTIQRWTKTGNIPIKVAQKIFAAHEAIRISQTPTPPVAAYTDPVTHLPANPPAQPEPQIDPVTHLPMNLQKHAPQIVGGRAVSAGGNAPDWIETDPTEQNFGINMTRPGRVSNQPMRPMKLREENGQKIAYVENTPPLAEQKNPDGSPKVTLPPSIPTSVGWAGPQTNESQPETQPTKSVS